MYVYIYHIYICVGPGPHDYCHFLMYVRGDHVFLKRSLMTSWANKSLKLANWLACA